MIDVLNGFAGYWDTYESGTGVYGGFVKAMSGEPVVEVDGCRNRSEAAARLREELAAFRNREVEAA